MRTCGTDTGESRRLATNRGGVLPVRGFQNRNAAVRIGGHETEAEPNWYSTQRCTQVQNTSLYRYLVATRYALCYEFDHPPPTAG